MSAGMFTRPMQHQTINPQSHNNWTCPSCFRPLAAQLPGETCCDHCGFVSVLTVEMKPACVATVISDGRQKNG